MLPSNHFSQDAIDWANTEIPDYIAYDNLQAEECHYEDIVNGDIKRCENRSQSMFLAECIHTSVSRLIDVYSTCSPYLNTNNSELSECLFPIWGFVHNNPRAVKTFNAGHIHSEMVELFLATSFEENGLQNKPNIPRLEVFNNPEDSDALGIDQINRILRQIKKCKRRVQVRKQKCLRMFKKALNLSSELLSSWGAFYCFRMELGLHLDRNERFDLQQAVQDRNEFLKRARDSGIFPEHSRYIWFLSDHQQKGFTHHFYILCDTNYVHNPDEMVDRIGRFWTEDITNGAGIYFSCEEFVDEKFHLKLGMGVVTAENNSVAQDFIFGLRYMCTREMYRCFYTDSIIETFGSGTFRNKKKVSSYPALHSIHGSNMASQHMHSNFHSRPSSVLAEMVSNMSTRHSIKVHLGRETHTRQNLNWIPGALNNGFLLVTGQSGSGKTNSVKQICVDLVQSRIPIWVLEPHNEFGGMGLTSILLSDGLESTQGVNPLMQYFADHTRRGMHDHARSVVDIVRRSAKNVGRREEEILHQAVEEVYERMGFSKENLSGERQPPTVASMIDLLQEWLHQDEKKGSRKIIEGCISVLRLLFGHPVFNRTEHFDIEKNLKVNVHFDLSVLSESDRYIVVETLLRQVFNYFSQLGPIPKSPDDDTDRFRLFIIIDEAKVLTMTGGDPESSSRMLNVLIAEGRKFGIGLVLASQKIDHFSKEVRANAAARLVHKTQDIKEAKQQAELLQLPPAALMSLEGEGDCFFWDGARPYRVKIPPYSDSPRRRLI